MAIRASQYSGVTSAYEWRSSLAALLTRTLTVPRVASTRAIADRSAAISVKSQAKNRGACAQRGEISATNCEEAFASMSRNATREPWNANSSEERRVGKE